MKISEVRPGGKIEIKATVKNIQPKRRTWMCFDCKRNNKEPFKGMWKDVSEFKEECPNCGAKELYKCPDKHCSQDIIKDGKYCAKCGKELESVQGKGLWLQHVTSALIEDDSGTVYLDLWNKDVDEYNIGDKIHLINGFARSNSSGSCSVSSGKYGTLRKIKEDVQS